MDTRRDDRQRLPRRDELVDIALKVVGVGSVGTACDVLLIEGRDQGDPLFLQAKEATESVLERQRVVQGPRQIQAQSDICLGWSTGREGMHHYLRRLRDRKRSSDVESA